MNWLKIINGLGLGFDIIGAVIMFLNTPHPFRKPSTGTISEAANYQMSGRHLEKREKNWVKIGFVFLIIGFSLQLISLIFSN